MDLLHFTSQQNVYFKWMCPDIRTGCFQPKYLICSCLMIDALSEGPRVNDCSGDRLPKIQNLTWTVKSKSGSQLSYAPTLAHLISIISQIVSQWKKPIVSFLNTGSYIGRTEERNNWLVFEWTYYSEIFDFIGWHIWSFESLLFSSGNCA